MSSILASMNRKAKRNFDKLSQEQKAEIIKTEIINKVSVAMSQEISKSMIYGIAFGKEQLYKNYVSKIDELECNGNNSSEEIQKLLSHIREEHFKFIQEERNSNKMDGE